MYELILVPEYPRKNNWTQIALSACRNNLRQYTKLFIIIFFSIEFASHCCAILRNLTKNLIFTKNIRSNGMRSLRFSSKSEIHIFMKINNICDFEIFDTFLTPRERLTSDNCIKFSNIFTKRLDGYRTSLRIFFTELQKKNQKKIISLRTFPFFCFSVPSLRG